MSELSLLALCYAAATVGLIHTVAGPDHYVPFIAMSKIGRWSMARTLLVTLGCGAAHVASSVAIGLVGIGLGWALESMTGWEAARGGWAGWLLVGFGLGYFIWGLRQAYRNRPHSHFHRHPDGTSHDHEHTHHGEHVHVHATGEDPTAMARAMTPWMLFVIFVLGPCEPLIPLILGAFDAFSWTGAAAVSISFALATLIPMTAIVLLAHAGLSRISVRPLQRFSHALAGFAVLSCGLAVKFGL